MKKVIGTHNSMSYLPVKQWYLKPFFWVAKCQSKTLEEQYQAGARLFDIRVRDDRFAHGKILYKSDDIYRILYDFLKNRDDVVLRMIHEGRVSDSDKFVSLVMWVKSVFPKQQMIGGFCKDNWVQVVDLPNPYINQQIGSMQSKYGKVFPKLWTKLNRKKIVFNDGYNLIDFI